MNNLAPRLDPACDLSPLLVQEMFQTLQSLVGVHYSEAQLEQIVMHTMAEFDQDGRDATAVHDTHIRLPGDISRLHLLLSRRIELHTYRRLSSFQGTIN